MSEPIQYSLQHATGSVEIALKDNRFRVATQGKGLLDKLKVIDIPLADLRNFCLVPTIRAQNISGKAVGEGSGRFAYDESYDSEFIFSYLEQGKLKNKRLFVGRQDGVFQKILSALQAKRPDASLLHLDPSEAQKQIGVLSATKALTLILGLLIGLPLVGVLISVVIYGLRGSH